MSSQEKVIKEKYLIDKRILLILKRAPKRGNWMKDLADKLKIPRPLLNYYLFGIRKKDKKQGGRLRDEICIRKEGNNRFIFLRNEHKNNKNLF